MCPMPTAPHPAEPTLSPHQGVGARFFRRLGSAVRSAVTGGIALARGRRSSTAPHPNRNPPAPRKPRAPRAPTAATSVRAARRGWIAGWFGLAGRLPLPSRRPPAAFPDDNAPYTPETHPGFSPEVCELLNTPVEDCDPNELHIVLAVFAQHLAESLPPELGMDAKALFGRLWGRLGAPQAEAWPDDAPAGEPPSPAPTTPEHAAPDAPPPIPAQQPAPADEAVPQAAGVRPAVPETASAFRRRRSRIRPDSVTPPPVACRALPPQTAQRATGAAAAAPVLCRLRRTALNRGRAATARLARTAANGATLWRSRRCDSPVPVRRVQPAVSPPGLSPPSPPAPLPPPHPS